MWLCPELTKFQSVLSEVINANAKIKKVCLQSSSQENVQHYFFYNRLMDHWHNAEIVQKQFYQMQSKLQLGGVVVRDSLYRFDTQAVKMCNDTSIVLSSYTYLLSSFTISSLNFWNNQAHKIHEEQLILSHFKISARTALVHTKLVPRTLLVALNYNPRLSSAPPSSLWDSV